MLPDTFPAPQGRAAEAPPQSDQFHSTRSRPGLGSVIARILGVALVLTTDSLFDVGVIRLDSFALILLLFSSVGMIAAILLHSWWALLIVPLANTVGFCGAGLVLFIFEASSHGGPEIRDPGQLAAEVALAALIWGVLPALIGALAGTLAWRGWIRWRGERIRTQVLSGRREAS